MESMPIVTDVDTDDIDVDFAKPVLQKEVWHNENPFSIVFVEDCDVKKKGKKGIKCETCSFKFLDGKTSKKGKSTVRIVPFDICLIHQESWMYPVYEDTEKKHFSHMKSSEPKQTAHYYCIDKGCLLKRHP